MKPRADAGRARQLRTPRGRGRPRAGRRRRLAPRRSTCAPSDIANMGFARAVDVPVVLVGDIDRGGVIASLVGTQGGRSIRPMPRWSRASSSTSSAAIRRCSPTACASSPSAPAGRRSASCRFFADAARLPAEDALGARRAMAPPGRRAVAIAVPILPHIANFDDLDPLEAGARRRARAGPRPATPLPGDADLVLLPGSKATIADLARLRATPAGTSTSRRIVRRGGARARPLRRLPDARPRASPIPAASKGRPARRGARPARRRDRARRRASAWPRSPATTSPTACPFPATRCISA